MGPGRDHKLKNGSALDSECFNIECPFSYSKNKDGRVNLQEIFGIYKIQMMKRFFSIQAGGEFSNKYYVF